mmetsp:Transcript_65929/g.183670  ORF Transcript_65929/g.183670 Transcript_65929/m.183670 type:complete len:219 (+) Transcript_65929:1394-2050(+)
MRASKDSLATLSGAAACWNAADHLAGKASSSLVVASMYAPNSVSRRSSSSAFAQPMASFSWDARCRSKAPNRFSAASSFFATFRSNASKRNPTGFLSRGQTTASSRAPMRSASRFSCLEAFRSAAISSRTSRSRALSSATCLPSLLESSSSRRIAASCSLSCETMPDNKSCNLEYVKSPSKDTGVPCNTTILLPSCFLKLVASKDDDCTRNGLARSCA